MPIDKRCEYSLNKYNLSSGTNIYDALKNALKIAKAGVPAEKLAGPEKNETSVDDPQKQAESNSKSNQKLRPIIIFLTDGEPTVRETRLHKIQTAVNELNDGDKAAIFR